KDRPGPFDPILVARERARRTAWNRQNFKLAWVTARASQACIAGSMLRQPSGGLRTGILGLDESVFRQTLEEADGLRLAFLRGNLMLRGQVIDNLLYGPAFLDVVPQLRTDALEPEINARRQVENDDLVGEVATCRTARWADSLSWLNHDERPKNRAR